MPCRKCCSCCRGSEEDEEEQEKEEIHAVFPVPPKVMPLEEIKNCCKKVENIYAVCVRLMQNYLGAPAYPYTTLPRQLYPYIVYLCSENKGRNDADEWAKRSFSKVQLTVEIKEVNIIHSKKTSYNNVYCELWIKDTQKHFTTIKEASGNILYEEVFVLDIDDCETDVLKLEVHSPRPGLLHRAAMPSGSANPPMPQAQTSTYYIIGALDKPIKEIPCVSQTLILNLTKRPQKLFTCGQISMFFQLGTKKRDDHVFHIQLYMELLQLTYEKQLEHLRESALFKNWLEILPVPALCLIQQHALQNGIAPIEQCVCSWLVTSSLKMNEENRISYYLLNTLLEGLASDIAGDPVSPNLAEALNKSISYFSDFCKDILRSLHECFAVENVEMADELYYFLSCVNCTEMKDFSNYLEAYDIIAKECQYWYFNAVLQYEDELKKEDLIVEPTCETLMTIVKTFLRHQIILDDIFTRAWSITFSKITYIQLNQVIVEVLKPIVNQLSDILGDPDHVTRAAESIHMLKLYHNLRNIINYVVADLPLEREKLEMEDYSKWFGENLIREWFLLCDVYIKPFIERSVDADSMEPMATNILHGTSVSDVSCIIDEMVIEVWTKLSYDDQLYTHGALITSLKLCLVEFTEAIKIKMVNESYFCKKSTFKVTPKLCVAMSNLYAVFEKLNSTKNKIKEFLRDIEAESGIPETILDVESELIHRVSYIYLSVMEKILKRCMYYTTKTVKSQMDVFKSSVISDACTFIEETLQMLYEKLNPEAFYVVLRQLWVVVIIAFNESLSWWNTCYFLFWRKKSAYLAALNGLTQLQTVFYCDGHGLSRSEMNSIPFMGLKRKIELMLQG